MRNHLEKITSDLFLILTYINILLSDGPAGDSILNTLWILFKYKSINDLVL